MPKKRQPFRWKFQLAWGAVFAINLIVPLGLGWGSYYGEGRLGILYAVFLFWVIGALVCVGSHPWGKRLVVGGCATALSQFLPILQLMSGILAQVLWYRVAEHKAPPESADLGLGILAQDASMVNGFAVTMLTGLFLETAALIAGSFLIWMNGGLAKEPAPVLDESTILE